MNDFLASNRYTYLQQNFDELMENPDIDYSSENGIDIINKTGCCDSCLNDNEAQPSD